MRMKCFNCFLFPLTIFVWFFLSPLCERNTFHFALYPEDNLLLLVLLTVYSSCCSGLQVDKATVLLWFRFAQSHGLDVLFGR